MSGNNEINHRLNARIEYQIDPSNFILFIPGIKIQNVRSSSTMNSATFFDELNPLSTTHNIYNANSDNWDASYRLLYNHTFKKPGRTFSVFNNSDFRGNNGKNTLDGENEFEDPAKDYETRQQSNIDKQWMEYLC
ncbi:MAG: hypothetical protein KL787_08085 [Taibaiella sp.]|nr:hypothetical protein [Taibaiella sp.]